MTTTTRSRAAISVQTFDDLASLTFQDWLSVRRRVLSTVRVSRSTLASLKTTLDFAGSMSAWMIVAPNGRCVASSAALFTDPAAARMGARAALRRVDDFELLQVQAATAPAYAWLMQLDGVPLVMPLRYYPTARLRNASAASVLGKLSSARLHTPAATKQPAAAGSTVLVVPNSHSDATSDANADDNVDEKVMSEPLLSSPLILGGPVRPLKTRGPQRPILPILRRQEQHHIRFRKWPPDTRV